MVKLPQWEYYGNVGTLKALEHKIVGQSNFVRSLICTGTFTVITGCHIWPLGPIFFFGILSKMKIGAYVRESSISLLVYTSLGPQY